MLSVVLVPVIKNKSRRINDSDNYRHIALASIVSKVVEKVILNRISEYLLTTLVHGPEATFSEICTTRRDKGSYVFLIGLCM